MKNLATALADSALQQLSFGNGRLEEFLLDQSITASQMRTPPIAVCIAAAMAIFNFTQLTRLPRIKKSQPICWERLRCWSKALQGLYSPQELAAEKLEGLLEVVGHYFPLLGQVFRPCCVIASSLDLKQCVWCFGMENCRPNLLGLYRISCKSQSYSFEKLLENHNVGCGWSLLLGSNGGQPGRDLFPAERSTRHRA